VDNKLVLYIVGVVVYYIYKEYSKQQSAAKNRKQELEQNSPAQTMEANEPQKPKPIFQPVAKKNPAEKIPATRLTKQQSVMKPVAKSSTPLVMNVPHSLEEDGTKHIVHNSMAQLQINSDEAYARDDNAKICATGLLHEQPLVSLILGGEILNKPAWQRF
jgi:hypothetical protein